MLDEWWTKLSAKLVANGVKLRWMVRKLSPAFVKDSSGRCPTLCLPWTKPKGPCVRWRG